MRRFKVKKSGMHVVYFTLLSLCNFTGTVMNYLIIKTRMLILLSCKITSYNFSNPFIQKPSLWHKSSQSEILSTHKVYTRIWAGSWCGNSKLGSFAWSFLYPLRLQLKKPNYDKKVRSFLYQYILRNRVNTDFFKIIYTFYSNLLIEVQVRISSRSPQNPLPVVTFYLGGIKCRHFDRKMHKHNRKK